MRGGRPGSIDPWIRESVDHAWPGARVLSAERIGEERGLDSVLTRVAIEGAGTPGSLVAKRWDLREGERELRFYEHLSASAGVRVPRCHLATSGSEHATLLLEDLSSLEPVDVLVGASPARARALVDALVVLHAGHRDAPVLSRHAEWLRSPISDNAARARRLRDLDDAALEVCRAPGATAAVLRRVLDALERTPDAPGRTLVHGDYHVENVLFEGDQLVVLDWQSVRTGDGCDDLARVLVEGVCPELAPGDRAALVERYRTGLARHGIRLAATELADRMQLAFCRLLVGALGWARGHGPLRERDRESALIASLVRRTLAALR